MGVEEGLLLKKNGQDLNEMIRDKVSETVIKINEVCAVGLKFKRYLLSLIRLVELLW